MTSENDYAGQLSSALQSHDIEEIKNLLSQLPEKCTSELRDQAIEAHMQIRQWKEALELLSKVKEANFEQSLQFNSCKNIYTLEQYRPKLNEKIFSKEPAGHYSIVSGKDSIATIAYANKDEQFCLSPNGDPQASLSAEIKKINGTKTEEAILLCGLGDGYLLDALQRESFENSKHSRVVYVVCPDEEAFCLHLMLHDLAHAQSAICDARFYIFCGDDWASQYDAALRSDLQLPTPSHYCKLGPHADSILKIAQQTHEKRALLEDALKTQANSICLKRNLTELEFLKPEMDSQKTKLLCLSPSELEDSLEDLNFELHVLSKKSKHHQIRESYLNQQIIKHRPDIVLEENRLRAESTLKLPSSLPLLSIFSKDSWPKSVDVHALPTNDHIFTAHPNSFSQKTGIPNHQISALPPIMSYFSQEQELPLAKDRLICISNASATPIQALNEQLKKLPTELKKIGQIAGEQLIDSYGHGASYHTRSELTSLIGQLSTEDSQSSDVLMEQLLIPLSKLLYAQQTIRWGQLVCRELGMELSIYGQGWEKNPDFGEHAEATAKSTFDANQALAQASIALLVDPTPCLEQQLLADSIANHTLAVFRNHLGHTAYQKILDCCEQENIELPKNQEEANSMELSEDLKLAAQIAQQYSNGPVADAFQQCHSYRDSGLIQVGRSVLPGIDQLVFENFDQLKEVLSYWNQNADEASAIVSKQRTQMSSYATLPIAMKRAFAQWQQKQFNDELDCQLS